MIEFKIDFCPKCGQKRELMFSNNPLSGKTICFRCINEQLDYNNIQHAEFFCRTYNLPWQPDLWLRLAEEFKENVYKQYTSILLAEKENQPNLAYDSTTRDLWSRTNHE